MRSLRCLRRPLSLRLARWLGGSTAGLVLAAAAGAQPALHTWPEADIALGEKLVKEHACTACHVRKVGGDGSAIYRPKGRIGTPNALLAMVEMCSTELNLGLFPEDVMAVAAVLQRDHYRFPRSPAPAVRAAGSP
jgi:hypothetical protein